MPNLAALRAAIFLLSAKNRWGGTYVPPGRARVKCTIYTALAVRVLNILPPKSVFLCLHPATLYT